jgi:hypothetical protein
MGSFTGALSELLGQRRDGAIHIAEKLVSAKNRRSLGLPGEESYPETVEW